MWWKSKDKQSFKDIPVVVLPTAIKAGLVKPEMLLIAAQNMWGDNLHRAQALIDSSHFIALEFFEAVTEDSSGHMAEMVMELIASLPPHLHGQAYKMLWGAILSIKSQEIRIKQIERFFDLVGLSSVQVREIRDEVLEISDPEEQLNIFHLIVPRLPRDIQEDTWRILIQRAVRRAGANIPSTHEEQKLLTALIRILPKEIIKQEADKIWNATYKLYESAIVKGGSEPAWGRYAIGVVVQHMPGEVLRHLTVDLLPKINEFEEWSMSLAADVPQGKGITACEILTMLAPYLPEEQRQNAFSQVESIILTLPNGKPSEEFQIWLSKILGRLPKAMLLELWNNAISEIKQVGGESGTGHRSNGDNLLKSLAKHIPVDTIYTNMAELVSLLPLYLCGEILDIIINRETTIEQANLWQQAISVGLALDSPYFAHPELAIELLGVMPGHFQQQYSANVMQKTRSLNNGLHYTKSMTQLAKVLSGDDQISVWLEAWQAANNLLQDGYGAETSARILEWSQTLNIFSDLLQIFSSIHEGVIESENNFARFKAINWEITLWESVLKVMVEWHTSWNGLAILLLHAPQDFSSFIWESHRAENIPNSLMLAILRHLSPEQWEEILPRLMGRYYTQVPKSDRFLILKWSHTLASYAWELMCNTFGAGDTHYSYPYFAQALAPSLPEEYLMPAFTLAIQRVDPWFLSETCDTLADRLPITSSVEAWKLIEPIDDPFVDPLKTKIASQLPESSLATLFEW